MFTDHLAHAITAAPLTDLDRIARSIWAAHAAGYLGDADASAAAEAVRARQRAARPRERCYWKTAPAPAPRRLQRSPDKQRSIERRRRLAASSPLPPQIACHFTLSELAALRVIADEVRHHGFCDRSVPEIAARAGTCATTVRNALREARALGLVSVRERRVSAFRNKSNIVTIIRNEWRVWLRLADKGGRLQKNETHASQQASSRKSDGHAAPFERRTDLPGDAGTPQAVGRRVAARTSRPAPPRGARSPVGG